MHKSELNPAPDLSIPTIPVICDRCRARGMAGDEAFSGVADILDFDPVPRRARAGGWTPEHQRAFIAALAITGSSTQAARVIGKHEFGAKALRTARGGRSFAAAWEAAEEIFRDRDRERIHANLKELADQVASADARFEHEGDGRPSEREHEREHEDPLAPYDVSEVAERLRKKMEFINRDYLRELARNPEKRRAYEVLNGPVDWDGLDR